MAKLYDKIIHYDSSNTIRGYTISDLIKCSDCKYMEKRMYFGKKHLICKMFIHDIPISVEPDGFCYKAKEKEK